LKALLPLLLTLFTILCCTTISGASIQETHSGVIFEKACVHEGGTGDWANFNAPKSTGNKFWKNSTEFNGTKVHQRNDIIDSALVDSRGRSNLQRMQKGLAPIGPDGKSVNLHHMTQSNTSPLAEMTQTFHQQNSKVIHINPNITPSGVDRNAFGKFRRDYWKNRVNDFGE